MNYPKSIAPRPTVLRQSASRRQEGCCGTDLRPKSSVTFLTRAAVVFSPFRAGVAVFFQACAAVVLPPFRAGVAALLLFVLLLTSCTSQKKVTYFQPKDLAKDIEQAAITQNNISKLQPGDILGIMVSSLSPEASAMFNPYLNAGVYATSQSNSTTLPATPGYLIDEDGTIALPLVGKLKVAGLSNKEVTDLITEKLTKYLAQPTVNVRILNFKISVLGEVNRPSVYIIPNEKVTLPEALSLAGDLSIYGKRENILLIREVEGKREFARIDITQRDFFNSPYYYLKANDLVYVEPKKRKITAGNMAVQFGPMIISALSLLIIVIVNAKNLGL